MARIWIYELRVHEVRDDFFLGYDYDGEGGRRGYATCEEVCDLVEEWICFDASLNVIVRSMNNTNNKRYWDLDITIDESKFVEDAIEDSSKLNEELILAVIKNDLGEVGLTFDYQYPTGNILEGNCEIQLKHFSNQDSGHIA